MLDVRTRQVHFEWIEAFSNTDLEGMRDLLNIVVETSGTNGYSSPLSQKEVGKIAASLEVGIRQGTAAQLLVRDSRDRIVGLCTLERPKQPDRHHILEIKRVAIIPRLRGTFLMRGWDVVLTRCEEMNAELLFIDVSEDGPHRLWERLGFETFAIMPDYARVGSRRLDGYYMTVYVDAARTRQQAFLARIQKGARRA